MCQNILLILFFLSLKECNKSKYDDEKFNILISNLNVVLNIYKKTTPINLYHCKSEGYYTIKEFLINEKKLDFNEIEQEIINFLTVKFK